MNNKNINPNYKGRFLKNIVADYNLGSLEFDKGTILVQQMDRLKMYFQLKTNHTYYNERTDKSRTLSVILKSNFMEILSGSAVDGEGRFVPDSHKFCFAQYVRVPADDELEWYEKQDTV